jgi:2-haloacid dehalogenase
MWEDDLVITYRRALQAVPREFVAAGELGSDEAHTGNMDQSQHTTESDAARRPSLIIFDVNETLSDLAPLQARFEDVGAPRHLAATWFASLLRDGFALTVGGESVPFSDLAATSLRATLRPVTDGARLDDAVRHVLDGISSLTVHPDVVEGVHNLSRMQFELVTLSNGAATVAEVLLTKAEVRGLFRNLLSVDDVGVWKPAAAAYLHALTVCDTPADQALLAAVHPWDVHGAARAGLGTAWINRTGATYPDYFATPDIEAASLVDLADQLR